MDRDEFCRVFGCDETEVERFIERGMPHHGDVGDPDEFDSAEVASWLVANGHAQINPDRVARTMTDASARLSVSHETLRRWSRMDGFPGRHGYYPLHEIQEWDEARDKKLNQHATESDREDNERPRTERELTIKERRDLLKLQREQEELIEVEEVRRMLVRVSSYIVAELNLLPARIESRLPAGFDITATRIMRDVTRETLNDCFELISEFDIWGEDEPRADEYDDAQVAD